jgi:hypothetical protein
MTPKLSLPTGVVDMHVHTSPDVRPRLMSDIDLAAEAARAGYRCLVLKSHHVSTAGRAGIAEQVVPDVRLLGGVALNIPTGGINPEAVEATADMGGRVVWMPTFSAANHVRYVHGPGQGGGLGAIGNSDRAVDIVDGEGQLLPDVLRMLDVVASRGLTLATGHLGPSEIMLVVPEARRRGVARVVITHPEMAVVGLPIDKQLQLAELGGVWFERVAVVTRAPFEYPVKDLVEAIRAVGVESTVLSTDLGQPGNPSPVQGMAEFIEAVRAHGVSSGDIESMVCHAPAAALALDEEETR